MKLVEILARELKEWPEGVNKLHQSFAGMIFYIDSAAQVVKSIRVDIASDWRETGVTRAEWESERTSLKAPKANGDGWVRNRGRKCPVNNGVLVDIKNRKGEVFTEIEVMADGDCWIHRNLSSDIMAYRIHKPAEQPVNQVDPSVVVFDDQICVTTRNDTEFAFKPAVNPIEWRDRIRELDTRSAEVESVYQRQISEITQERESLVQKLAGEGLALAEVVVHPAEGMSDWRNWKAGDLVEWIGLFSQNYTIGKTYEVEKVLHRGLMMDDNNGGRHNWGGDQAIARSFKWHSRPAI
jgi:hypothetical protein